MQNSDPRGAAGPAPASIRSVVPRLERLRLHDTVVEHLRELIVEGALAPGVKLNERELCETLGISRTPLREAFKVLAAEGLIELSPNRGASVSAMSEREIWETFELMSALEALSGELACARITAAELDELKAQHYLMLAAKARGDLPGYYSRNQEIHDRINTAAGNAVLRATYVSLNRRLKALRFKSNLNPGKWERAAHDHEAMIAALEQRDGTRLAVILRQHLLDKRDAVLGTIAPAIGAPAIGAPAIGAPAIGAPAIGTSAIGPSAIGPSAIEKPATEKPAIGALATEAPATADPSAAR